MIILADWAFHRTLLSAILLDKGRVKGVEGPGRCLSDTRTGCVKGKAPHSCNLEVPRTTVRYTKAFFIGKERWTVRGKTRAWGLITDLL